MKRLHPIMLAGTGSDVGKSILATALCRIFLQDGYTPAPFKAQNMALNSYATPEGLEIGRAQAVQAEAAGIPCHTDMNPLLLKPQSDHTSQVVLNGIPIGNRDAYDFWRREGKTVNSQQSTVNDIDFPQEVHAAFDRLNARYNPIVMEGAGSISEINLRDHDLVNMPMARHANADVVLVECVSGKRPKNEKREKRENAIVSQRLHSKTTQNLNLIALLIFFALPCQFLYIIVQTEY